MDFNSFSIAGPSTISTSEYTTLNGQATTNAATGKASNTNTQCLTDSFSVTNPGGTTPPMICGSNAGEHSELNKTATSLSL